jgi:hypothetical protein
MPELIAVKKILYHDDKTKTRGEILPGQRFKTENYPMISQKEFESMLLGSPQIVRLPSEENYAAPPELTVSAEEVRAAQRAAATEPVVEGRSPRTDTGPTETPEERLARLRRDDDDDDDEDSRPAARSRRAKKDEDDI